MDKVKFRNTKAKPFSTKSVLQMLDKAWPSDSSGDEDEVPRKKGKPNTKIEDDDYEDVDDDYGYEEDEAEEQDYSDMSAKELFNLCKKRKIDAVPKKSQKYYIKLLEDYDDAQEDWGDEEDEWEDE